MNMSSEKTNKGPSLGYDEANTESINGEYDSADMKNFDVITANTTVGSTNDKSNIATIMVDKKLRNAMESLQIVPGKKMENPSHAMRYQNDLQHDERMQPVIEQMNHNATKLLPTRLATVRTTSTSSLPKLKSNVNISMNKSVSKHVIKTISNTADGIHLKEEKINFFGIPVTTNHKKRTQIKPFNFQIRTKESQQMRKSCTTLTKPYKSTAATNNSVTKTKIQPKSLKENTQINRLNKISGNTIVTEKMGQTITEGRFSKLENITRKKSKPEVSICIKKTSNENDIPTDNIIESENGKSKFTAVNSNVHTNRRHEFRDKMRKREQEIKEMRANIERKRRDKENFCETLNSC